MRMTTPNELYAKRFLWIFGAVIVILHSMGTLAEPLGSIGPTRWADWFDLFTPLVIVPLGAAALFFIKTPRLAWMMFGLGAIIYVEGHGIHLAANSVGNVTPGPTEHLWDEVIGHHIWLSGLWIMVGALASQFVKTDAHSRLAFIPAVSFGFNGFLDGIEGGTVVLMTVCSLFFLVWSLREWQHLGRYLAISCAITLVAIYGWGIYWHGFPQFSSLGWI